MASKYSRKEVLRAAANNADAQILRVNQLFSAVQNEDALITSPLPGKWSAKQCVEHLILTMDVYIPRITRAIESGVKSDEDQYPHGRFGKKFADSMLPKTEGGRTPQMKTFKSLQPGVTGASSIDVVMSFAEQMKTIKTLIQKSQYLDLKKARVTSAVGPILRFRLGDVYPFLLAHNERHIIQAEKAVELCLKH